MAGVNKSAVKVFAQGLRREMSLPERMIWARIRVRDAGWPIWRRQHPIGPYVADFYCAKAKLVVEIDGLSHSTGDRAERDEVRDAYMRAHGYEVMRYPAEDVLRDPGEVADGMVRRAVERVGK